MSYNSLRYIKVLFLGDWSDFGLDVGFLNFMVVIINSWISKLVDVFEVYCLKLRNSGGS